MALQKRLCETGLSPINYKLLNEKSYYTWHVVIESDIPDSHNYKNLWAY